MLSGNTTPGGRLPISIPRAEADSPVLHARPDNGALVYAEGHLVGYRGYDRNRTEPLFCFGHGLGYTDWTYESLKVPAEVPAGAALDIVVRDKVLKVSINGQLVAEGPTAPERSLTGPIGLQLHDQFTFLLFRNIRIRPLP